MLIRTSQDAGYGQIARACRHDNSWVCRWLQGEGRASVAEVLAWLDVCGLSFSDDTGVASGDAELLQLLVHQAAAKVDRSLDSAPEEGDVSVPAADYRALLALARRALVGMQEGGSE